MEDHPNQREGDDTRRPLPSIGDTYHATVAGHSALAKLTTPKIHNRKKTTFKRDIERKPEKAASNGERAKQRSVVTLSPERPTSGPFGDLCHYVDDDYSAPPPPKAEKKVHGKPRSAKRKLQGESSVTHLTSSSDSMPPWRPAGLAIGKPHPRHFFFETGPRACRRRDRFPGFEPIPPIKQNRNKQDQHNTRATTQTNKNRHLGCLESQDFRSDFDIRPAKINGEREPQFRSNKNPGAKVCPRIARNKLMDTEPDGLLASCHKLIKEADDQTAGKDITHAKEIHGKGHFKQLKVMNLADQFCESDVINDKGVWNEEQKQKNPYGQKCPCWKDIVQSVQRRNMLLPASSQTVLCDMFQGQASFRQPVGTLQGCDNRTKDVMPTHQNTEDKGAFSKAAVDENATQKAAGEESMKFECNDIQKSQANNSNHTSIPAGKMKISSCSSFHHSSPPHRCRNSNDNEVSDTSFHHDNGDIEDQPRHENVHCEHFKELSVVRTLLEKEYGEKEHHINKIEENVLDPELEIDVSQVNDLHHDVSCGPDSTSKLTPNRNKTNDTVRVVKQEEIARGRDYDEASIQEKSHTEGTEVSTSINKISKSVTNTDKYCAQNETNIFENEQENAQQQIGYVPTAIKTTNDVKSAEPPDDHESVPSFSSSDKDENYLEIGQEAACEANAIIEDIPETIENEPEDKPLGVRKFVEDTNGACQDTAHTEKLQQVGEMDELEKEQAVLYRIESSRQVIQTLAEESLKGERTTSDKEQEDVTDKSPIVETLKANHQRGDSGSLISLENSDVSVTVEDGNIAISPAAGEKDNVGVGDDCDVSKPKNKEEIKDESSANSSIDESTANESSDSIDSKLHTQCCDDQNSNVNKRQLQRASDINANNMVTLLTEASIDYPTNEEFRNVEHAFQALETEQCLNEDRQVLSQTRDIEYSLNPSKTEQALQESTRGKTTLPVTAVDQVLQASASEHALQSSASAQALLVSALEQELQSSAPEQPLQASASEQALQTSALEQLLQSSASEQPLQASTSEQALQDSASEQLLQSSASEQALHASTSEQTLQTSASEQLLQSSASEQALQASASEQALKSAASEQASQFSTSEQALSSLATEQALQILTSEKASPISISEKASTSDQALQTSSSEQSPEKARKTLLVTYDDQSVPSKETLNTSDEKQKDAAVKSDSLNPARNRASNNKGNLRRPESVGGIDQEDIKIFPCWLTFDFSRQRPNSAPEKACDIHRYFRLRGLQNKSALKDDTDKPPQLVTQIWRSSPQELVSAEDMEPPLRMRGSSFPPETGHTVFDRAFTCINAINYYSNLMARYTYRSQKTILTALETMPPDDELHLHAMTCTPAAKCAHEVQKYLSDFEDVFMRYFKVEEAQDEFCQYVCDIRNSEDCNASERVNQETPLASQAQDASYKEQPLTNTGDCEIREATEGVISLPSDNEPERVSTETREPNSRDKRDNERVLPKTES